MRKGFTLIELMIVIAIIAIIAAIAIPNLLESRITSNESAAASGLKSGIFPGEVQFQAGGYIDDDDDNRGEYGHLPHMSGSDRAWTGSGGNIDASVNLTLIGVEFRGGTADGSDDVCEGDNASSGYFFSSALDGIDAISNREKFYAVVCRPEAFDDTGRRSFVITQEGKVLTDAPVEYANGDAVLTAAFGGNAQSYSASNRTPVWSPYAK